MSGTPSKEVKVPASAANYTAGTVDPALRSQINQALIEEGHAARIHERLLHVLHANNNNWPTLIQNHASKLLRDNEVSTYPQLMKRVLEDVRRDQQLQGSKSGTGTGSGGSGDANGSSSSDSKDGKDKANGESKKGGGAVNGAGSGDKQSLAVPAPVVDEALKVTRESLLDILTQDGDG